MWQFVIYQRHLSHQVTSQHCRSHEYKDRIIQQLFVRDKCGSFQGEIAPFGAL